MVWYVLIHKCLCYLMAPIVNICIFKYKYCVPHTLVQLGLMHMTTSSCTIDR